MKGINRPARVFQLPPGCGSGSSHGDRCCAACSGPGRHRRPARTSARRRRAAPYADMPAIAPIGVRIDKYLRCARQREGASRRSRQGLPHAEPRRRSVHDHRWHLPVDVHDLRGRRRGRRRAALVRGTHPDGDCRGERQADHAPRLQPLPRRSHRRRQKPRRPARDHRARGDEPAAGARRRSESPAGDRHVRRPATDYRSAVRCSSCRITARRTRRATSSSTRRSNGR